MIFDDVAAETRRVETAETLAVASEHSLPGVSFAEMLRDTVMRHDGDCILFDVGGPELRDVVRYNVVQGLLLVIHELLRERSTIRIGVFFGVELGGDDLVAPGLKRVAADTRVRVLFGSGAHWGAYLESKKYNVEKLRHALEQAKLSSRDALRRKLIRRVGDYGLPSSGQRLVHYYDGSSATDEIYGLLVEFLEDLSKRGRAKKIAYDCRHSPWFSAPVRNALSALGIQDRAVEITDEASAPTMLNDATVLLLPIVRTGTSLQAMLRSIDVSATGAVPEVWSLLSTEGTDQWTPAPGIRDVRFVDAKGRECVSRVAYELGVPATSAELLHVWQSSPTTPINPETEKLSDRLRPDSMWAMILEGGMIKEDPVPPTRGRLGYVPDFGQIAILNGPFIAAKVDAWLQEAFVGQAAPQLAFLCPQEKQASVVARSLGDLAGHGAIEIPRALINFFRDGQKSTDLSAIEENIPAKEFENDLELRPKIRVAHHQLAELETLTSKLGGYDRPQVVILDEFDFSGGTIDSLYNLAKSFRLPVLCSVVLSSLGAGSQRIPTLTRFSLYTLNYNSKNIPVPRALV